MFAIVSVISDLSGEYLLYYVCVRVCVCVSYLEMVRYRLLPNRQTYKIFKYLEKTMGLKSSLNYQSDTCVSSVILFCWAANSTYIKAYELLYILP